MFAPVSPPVSPMLAKLAREVPTGDFAYEPKWDGFRCLAFRSGADVDLRSRHDRRMARYFPEVAEALRTLPEPSLALDGELVVAPSEGLDFGALLSRIHPSTPRVERLRREAPACFIAFDALAIGERDLRSEPYSERRAALERL